MKRYLGISFATFCSLLLVAGIVMATPTERLEVGSDGDGQSYLVGDVDGAMPAPSKVLEDTIWIADWSFNGASCNSTGWVKYDNRIANDGTNYWHVSTAYNGTGGIVNNAAVLSKHDLAWARDGYGNNWDYSIILKYKGTGSTLSFDYLSDSEP
jgi:hypothetical protein